MDFTSILGKWSLRLHDLHSIVGVWFSIMGYSFLSLIAMAKI